MHVEECTLALLQYYLPHIDKKRNGTCIDIGVGTFAFYCELFALMGYNTIAVEPLPTSKLINICNKLKINLIKSCVSDIEGTVTLFIGTFNGKDNQNLSSILSDWWGASSNTVEVPSMNLNSVIQFVNMEKITCLKLDVEGVESIIIRQLKGFDQSLLPQVIVFEYGGGSVYTEGKGGWSKDGIKSTMECFHILKELHYRDTILIDSASGFIEKIVDLKKNDLNPEQLFSSESIYGNAICMQNTLCESEWIQNICSKYRDNDLQPPKLKIDINFLYRFVWKLRRNVRRLVK